MLCNQPNKTMIDGECKDKVEILPSSIEKPPPKADNCKDGCLEWGEWSNWSIPPGGESCPSSSSFNPPSADTDKKRTRSRTCPTLATGVECLTANTEIKRCWWCQGQGQIFNADGKCVCDVEQGYYKDNSASPPHCKQCVAGRTPNETGDGCICANTEAETKCGENNSKEWDDINCECTCKLTTADCPYGVTEDCRCVVAAPMPEPEPEEIVITLYHGCFTDPNNTLYMPMNSKSLGSSKWKKTCLGNNYEANADTLLNPNSPTGAKPIIQKLYNCAKNSNETDFINELVNINKNCLERASHPYTITITP